MSPKSLVFPWLHQSDPLLLSHPWVDQLVCPLWCPSWKGTPLWDAYIPWRPPVSSCHLSPPLSAPCQQLRLIYIHSCFPENWKCKQQKGLFVSSARNVKDTTLHVAMLLFSNNLARTLSHALFTVNHLQIWLQLLSSVFFFWQTTRIQNLTESWLGFEINCIENLPFNSLAVHIHDC